MLVSSLKISERYPFAYFDLNLLTYMRVFVNAMVDELSTNLISTVLLFLFSDEQIA